MTMNRILFIFLATALVSLLATSDAQAWGAVHRGYTFHTPAGGFYHVGGTAAYGPYGEHTGYHSYGYSPYAGAYHTGYGQTAGYGGSAYHYSTGYRGYGGYYGGYRGLYGYGDRYAGVYRRW
jgi:hypothetical protein